MVLNFVAKACAKASQMISKCHTSLCEFAIVSMLHVKHFHMILHHISYHRKSQSRFEFDFYFFFYLLHGSKSLMVPRSHNN